ncbi:dTDP-4-dehydrorhamnose reductase [Cognatitamlana onchidii]|uniref:dTDP-4-dehydrorhamnose reductase n=1 Tax=Cognatitamlana onchidii TaxID=2562860 RepID=UPI0010A663A5|nr:dTDP-4-dehydrorhamnose reductase [Algibacter onchidii]
MINILVTGASGQLGHCIRDLSPNYMGFNFIYTDYQELDICKMDEVIPFFESNQVDYCINCAAYTAVDEAESDVEKSYKINALGPKNLASACARHNAVLIHISTDFVFNGNQSVPYTEEDMPEPINVYGASKLKGEKEIGHTFSEHFIIRTAWLYSEHGNNFLKTMLRLAKTKEVLSVVNDQIGTPTYARDLANVILKLIAERKDCYGLYHYSNAGIVSWYDFAKEIFDLSEATVQLNPIKSEEYPTPAARPAYSVMNKGKIKDAFSLNIPYWKDSLSTCLSRLK